MTSYPKATWIHTQGRWQCKAQVNGVRKTFASAQKGRAGQREAEEKARAWIDGQVLNGSVRADTIFTEYLQRLKDTGGASTAHYTQSESLYRVHVKPVIGHIKMNQLTLGRLQTVLDMAYAKNKLAKKTLMDIRGVISGGMKYARSYNATAIHTDMLTIPRGAVPKQKDGPGILMPEMVRTVFTSDVTTYCGKTCQDWCINRYRFAIATGLRPGEIAGLKRSDRRGDVVSVSRAINYCEESTTGKNNNARRKLCLTPMQAQIWDAQLSLLKQSGVVSPWLFPGPDGQPLKQRTAASMWHRYCLHNGIDESVTPYRLRHTWCSINKQMPDALKKRAMGHSKDMDTNGVYDHDMGEDAALIAMYTSQALEAVLCTPKKPTKNPL